MIIRYNQRTSPTFAALSAFYDYFEESRRLISEAGQAARLEYEEAIRRGGLPEDEEEANSLLAEAVLAEEPYHGIMGTLRYSSVVFLFGIVEHQVRRVLHTNPGSAANAPKRTAAKPQAFLDELLLHLRQSCAAELGTFPEFSRLRNLQIVRDCIAHCNGHVDLSRDKKALLEMSDFK